DAAYLQKQMQIAQKEEAGIQLTQEEFDFMADACACEEIERVNANCTLKDNLQEASTSDRQMQMIGGNGGNQFRQYAGNLNGYNAVQYVGNQVAQNPRVQNDGILNQVGNGNLVAVRAEGNAAGHNGNQIRCYNCRGKEEAGIQLQAKEYDLMAAAVDLDKIEEVNANCILMANLQQASSSDGSAEVHEKCDNNEIFNMFTQEE
nr:hypothetical protein [Tanacetum cinerariifolium]